MARGAPAVKRSNDRPDEAKSPISSRYCYPNERWAHDSSSQHDFEVPLVPPSRRKFAAMREERKLMAANGENTSALAAARSKDGELQKKAQLRVSKLLADAARGRAPDGLRSGQTPEQTVAHKLV